MEHSLGVRKGAWSQEEDNLLKKCIEEYGEGNWHRVPVRTGLNRCRKSCRLRWLNYLNPNIKRGKFSEDEVDLILRLHKLLGNRWSLIAGRLPGRTANDVKNYWNSHLRKKADHNEDVKGKTQKPENINIIKPRPRTFSENSPWLSGKSKISNNVQLGHDNLKTSAPVDHLQENETAWWESLLSGNEFDPGASTGSADDLSFDVELWSLFNADRETLN